MIQGLDPATVAVGGGLFTAASVVLVALIRSRTGDRELVFRSQQEHMDRLTAERKQAIEDRDLAYAEAESWRRRYEADTGKRAEAEAHARTSALAARTYEHEIAQLSRKITALRAQLAQVGVVS